MKTLLKFALCAVALGMWSCSDDDDSMKTQDMTKWEDVEARQLWLTINGKRLEGTTVKFLDADNPADSKGTTIRINWGDGIGSQDVYVTAKPSGDGLKLRGEAAEEGAYEMSVSGFFTDKPLSASFVHTPQMTLDVEYRVTSPLAGATYDIDMADQPISIPGNFTGTCTIGGNEMQLSDVVAHACECINNEYAAKGSKVRVEYTADGLKRTYVKSASSDEYVRVWNGRYFMNDTHTITVEGSEQAGKYISDTWLVSKADSVGAISSLVMNVDMNGGDMALSLTPWYQYEFMTLYLHVRQDQTGWSKYDVECLAKTVEALEKIYNANSAAAKLWQINCKKAEN